MKEQITKVGKLLIEFVVLQVGPRAAKYVLQSGRVSLITPHPDRMLLQLVTWHTSYPAIEI
eukprot:6059610-Amphidinium_carterae.1